jgi:hypothetical protein
MVSTIVTWLDRHLAWLGAADLAQQTMVSTIVTGCYLSCICVTVEHA